MANLDALDELPGAWPNLLADVRDMLSRPIPDTKPFVRLVEAVKYLIEACPDDNAVQLAARRGGKLAGDFGGGNKAVAMMRAGAVVEMMQEAQKEKSSVTAYRRMLKAMRLLGIDDPDAINLILYGLEYHDRDGKPYDWLARKLQQKGRSDG
jgi:hypothetical protein